MSKYIDKDELYKTIRAKMRSCDTDTDYGRGIQQGFDFAMSIIEQQPAADYDDRTGFWIEGVNEETKERCFQCSRCGLCNDHITNYCDVCGADMQDHENGGHRVK